jgi:ABC-type transport system involved in multi-copper enzyme maturation permease subunit
MWLTHVRALAAKEVLEGFRAGWRFALQILALAGFMNWFIIRSYVVSVGSDPLQLRVAASVSVVYVAMIVIPFLANGHLIRSLVEERQKQSILSLLATGVTPQVMWLTKLVMAAALSYLVMLVSIGLHLLVTVLYWHVMPVFTTQIVLGALVVSPLLAFAVVALMAFFFWYFRYPHMVASIVPVVVAMASWGYASRSPGSDILRNLTIIACVAPFVITAIGAFLIARLSKQRIAGL